MLFYFFDILSSKFMISANPKISIPIVAPMPTLKIISNHGIGSITNVVPHAINAMIIPPAIVNHPTAYTAMDILFNPANSLFTLIILELAKLCNIKLYPTGGRTSFKLDISTFYFSCKSVFHLLFINK